MVEAAAAAREGKPLRLLYRSCTDSDRRDSDQGRERSGKSDVGDQRGTGSLPTVRRLPGMPFLFPFTQEPESRRRNISTSAATTG